MGSLRDCFVDSMARQGDRKAITFLREGNVESEISYKGLDLDSNRMANTCLDLGVAKGDRVILFFPTYWHLMPPLLSDDIAQGVTEEGYPWIGAKDPELEITEFTDYQCFQCKKMHYYLRQLVANYPDKIRLIHRHFPMDHQYNPLVKERYHLGSGAMSLLAKYAQTQGKFWEMNDALYRIADRKRKKKINLQKLAEIVGLESKALAFSIQQKNIRYQVKHDISIGIKLGINGTPGYLIKDKVYVGLVPPAIIKSVLN